MMILYSCRKDSTEVLNVKEMNRRQEQIVEQIRKDAFEAFDYGHGDGTYKYKRFDVKEIGDVVRVSAAVMQIRPRWLGDFDDIYEVLLFVGPRGAIYYYKPSGNKLVKKHFESYEKTCKDQGWY